MFSDIPGEKYFSAMEPLTVLDKIGIEKTAEEKKDVDKQIIEVVKTIKPIGIDSTIKKAQVKKQIIYEFADSRAAQGYRKLTENIAGMI
jgi:nitrogenase subunit NifH